LEQIERLSSKNGLIRHILRERNVHYDADPVPFGDALRSNVTRIPSAAELRKHWVLSDDEVQSLQEIFYTVAVEHSVDYNLFRNGVLTDAPIFKSQRLGELLLISEILDNRLTFGGRSFPGNPATSGASASEVSRRSLTGLRPVPATRQPELEIAKEEVGVQVIAAHHLEEVVLVADMANVVDV